MSDKKNLEKINLSQVIAGKSISKKVMSPREIAEFEISGYNAMRGDDVEDLDCPICLNRKSTARWSREEERIIYITCECVAKRNNLRRLRLSGLTESLKKCKFETYICENSWQEAIKQKALKNSTCKNWFFIGGQTGAGKTHLCVSIISNLIEQGKNVNYMLWRDVIAKIKALVNTPEYFVIIKQLKTIEVLYLDDFFKVEQGKLPTQSDVNIAWEILNFRYNQNLKTIISTELLLADIENIDESTAGRIIEKATREFCVNIGKDKSKNFRTKDKGEVY